jgi:glutathione S-transferase
MLRVLGRKNSSNVQKVVWACAEMNLPYVREDYGGPFGKVKDAPYLGLNPNALVPTIDDDGFVLWESNAIVRYLAAKHGMGGLMPSDLRVRADADRWMDWATTTVAPAIFPVFWGLVRTPPGERDAAAIEAGKKKTNEVFGLLEGYLAKRKFAAGNEFSMGDIPLGIQAFRWVTLIADRPKLPGVEAWYARLMERPAFREHVAFGLT